MTFRITYDRYGTPGFLAENVVSGFRALGVLHARHRPLQTLILAAAARGELARTLIPKRELVEIDKLVARLCIRRIGESEAKRLTDEAARKLDAYAAGIMDGIRDHGMPLELRLLGATIRPPDRATILSGLLIGACLGLAQCQERMERAIVDALYAGADESALMTMFAPHLSGWDPTLLRKVSSYGQIAPGALITAGGGSNAWAVSGQHTATGKPLLAGDPHLQANQLPSLMFEVRARIAGTAWLGATIPGLPGLAVGRNDHLAWSGTFGVADNVDHWVEAIDNGVIRRDQAPPEYRHEKIERRFLSPVHQHVYSSSRGVLAWDGITDGHVLASRWAATEGVAETFDAYARMPFCKSAAEAEQVLTKAQTLTLHFVLADTSGDVRYVQVGRIPERSDGWSGLYPSENAAWVGTYTGARMPRTQSVNGIEVSANEARLAPDGAVLSTLAQPPYRRSRITQLLAQRRDHDVASMQTIQQDLFSLQAERLAPLLVKALPSGKLRDVLMTWDRCYDEHSIGAHAFELARNAALHGLDGLLGGGWYRDRLSDSEMIVWWSTGLDRLLTEALNGGVASARVYEMLGAVAKTVPRPWGEVQSITYGNIVLAGLPEWTGFNIGPLPLVGSIATVSQGSIVRSSGTSVCIAPVYRFTTDLSDLSAFTSIPGGIDGSRFGTSYTSWLDDHRAGRYHRIVPPEIDEA
ncbi:MAG: penicillin acylase family protein [Clostridia bacterium]|nr:penicillin acylase family protein [Deltaproteobacteria bacterium]